MWKLFWLFKQMSCVFKIVWMMFFSFVKWKMDLVMKYIGTIIIREINIEEFRIKSSLLFINVTMNIMVNMNGQRRLNSILVSMIMSLDKLLNNVPYLKFQILVLKIITMHMMCLLNSWYKCNFSQKINLETCIKRL